MTSEQEKPSYFWKAFAWPLLFVAVMWMFAWLQYSFGLNLDWMGIFPRKLQSINGIITTLFVHANFEHLFNNSAPLLVLGTALFYFFPNAKWRILLFLSIFTGVLIWIFARPSYHIGASGLVYALAFFMFFSGIFKKHRAMMGVSLLIVTFYGSMVWGVLPGEEHISWEAHLFGALTGIAAAYLFRKYGPAPPPPPHWFNDDQHEQTTEQPHISHYKKMPLDE